MAIDTTEPRAALPTKPTYHTALIYSPTTLNYAVYAPGKLSRNGLPSAAPRPIHSSIRAALAEHTQADPPAAQANPGTMLLHIMLLPITLYGLLRRPPRSETASTPLAVRSTTQHKPISVEKTCITGDPPGEKTCITGDPPGEKACMRVSPQLKKRACGCPHSVYAKLMDSAEPQSAATELQNRAQLLQSRSQLLTSVWMVPGIMLWHTP